MYDDGHEPVKAMPRDERVELMERFVGLDQAIKQATSTQKETAARLDDLYKEIRQVKTSLLQHISPESLPQEAAAR